MPVCMCARITHTHTPLHHSFLVATCSFYNTAFHAKGKNPIGRDLRRKGSEMNEAWGIRALPFCTVVLATEDSHLLVVKKGHASQGPALGVIQVAADVLGFGEKREVRFG